MDRTSKEVDRLSKETGLASKETRRVGRWRGKGWEVRRRRRKEPRLPPPMAAVGGGLWVFEEREQREKYLAMVSKSNYLWELKSYT